MKTKITLLTLLLVSLLVNAQPFYKLSKLSGTYTNLTGLTSTHNNQPWQKHSISFTYTLPFNININGANYKFVEFDGANMFLHSISGSEVEIYATGISIADRTASNTSVSVSPVGYKVEGTVGNRIFKMQFKNVGSAVEKYFYSVNTSYTNIQLWLYETSNIIEYHIGSNNINQYHYPEEPVTIFGFGGEPSTGSFVCVLYQNAQNPLLGEYTHEGQVTPTNYGLSDYPLTGTVYRFTPFGSASTPENFINNVKVYPNPATDYLAVEGLTNSANYGIFSLNGSLVASGIVAANNSKINVQTLPVGTYMLKIHSAVVKFVKK